MFKSNYRDIMWNLRVKMKKKNNLRLRPQPQWRTQGFCSREGGSNSVEDRGFRERGSGGGSPL